MCIGDNASFSCGGGHTLVGTNYAHVACLVYGEIFRFAALLGIVLTCDVYSRMTSYTHST